MDMNLPACLIGRFRDPSTATKLTHIEANDLVAKLNREEEEEGTDDGWNYQSEPYGQGYIVSVSDRIGLLGYL